ncbi:MAG: bifunctional folylpolyglutamate synthase/dihydrofolate synthase [Bacteroidia bacterium]|nr:bifunctional folylpolyglutamate synthase/dihydrofolate synthase [Bacteroidia bacterium]
MNYSQTLEYLFSQLPMFHRIGAAAYKANLDNTIALCNSLKNPQNSFKSVHIAGTNGKGSCSHMLAAIFQSAGYKTGLYTSPHLKDFRERIRINGEMIPEKKVTDFVQMHKSAFETIQLSFFEWTVGLAFDYFAREKVDIAIIETGLGGRLDSTNIITPELSLITNISYDHMQLLGDTLEKIAIEKAGIIKQDTPVVIGERQENIDSVFIDKAKTSHSEITFASDQITVEKIKNEVDKQFFNIYIKSVTFLENLEISLAGNYQQKNICSVLAAVQSLQESGWKITTENIRTALSNIQSLTGLMGRWQKISDSPLTICDVGHNKAGIAFILEQLKEYKYDHLRMVIGVVNDKDITGILEMLPKNATYYFCRANIPRALDANELKLLGKNYGLEGESYPSVKAALEQAKAHSLINDLIFIGGSTFVVAEID